MLRTMNRYKRSDQFQFMDIMSRSCENKEAHHVTSLPDFVKVDTSSTEVHYDGTCGYDKLSGEMLWTKVPSTTKFRGKMKETRITNAIKNVKRVIAGEMKRGDTRPAARDYLVGMGLRMDQNGNFGKYVVKDNVTEEELEDAKRGVQEICKHLNWAVKSALPWKTRKMMENMLNEITESSKLPKDFVSLDGLTDSDCIFVQIACALNYIGSSHTDGDLTMSACSCFSETLAKVTEEKNKAGFATKDDSDVCMYFVFPEYGIAVPMRSGDIIFFNPQIQHCCSYPRSRDVYSFSAYTSIKTMRNLDILPDEVIVRNERGNDVMS